MITDTLRPPPLFDPSAAAYKDWLNLNVFDPASGAIGIFNASLHGSPRDASSRAVGTALVHLPDEGWFGNVDVMDAGAANVGTTWVALERVALATDPSAGTVLVSARLPQHKLEAGLTCSTASRPVDISHPLPFGPGWISWYAVPRLTVTGGLVVAGRRIPLTHAVAYHDHNWGRWHWGDDVGWKWGTCAGGDVTLVVSRATNRAHTRESGTMLVVELPGERLTFGGNTVTIAYHGHLAEPLRRLPGALAALHQDRRLPNLPARIGVIADDGVARVDIAFDVRAAAQLIAGDPARRGYGFLHELVGTFEATVRHAGRTFGAEGLAVFEHVD